MARKLFASLICLSACSLALYSTANGQAGSIGGTVGKQDKSVSGGGGEAPAASPPASTKRAGSRQTNAHSEDSENPKTATRGSIAGRWAWDIKCPSANFTGVLTVVQTGDTFTGEFGHTNFWDNGTISNGRVKGSSVTFDRDYLGVDHVGLTLSGSVMQGPHDNPVWGHCYIHAAKST
jgi:hypothetical protein